MIPGFDDVKSLPGMPCEMSWEDYSGITAKSAQYAGDPRFYEILAHMAAIHDKKSRDYGTEGEPLKNCRAAEGFNVPAWVGVMIRANDKMQRIQNFVCKGKLENEGVEDALLDLATYTVMALVLYREVKSKEKE